MTMVLLALIILLLLLQYYIHTIQFYLKMTDCVANVALWICYMLLHSFCNFLKIVVGFSSRVDCFDFCLIKSVIL